MRDTLDVKDVLSLWNDGSFEYDAEWLTQFLFYPNGYVLQNSHLQPNGIQVQRQMHLRHFLVFQSFTHLYLTDHDCLHDPTWRENALRLQSKYDHKPICLYNTQAHVRLPGNTIEDNPESEVIWRKVAPGVSYLLTREHVDRLAPHISSLQHFDWQIPQLIGPFAVSRVGYIDHIGWSGERHPVSEGPDGGDRVINPTPWLVAKRAEVVAKLKEAQQ
jgi:hypothetical protein